MWSCLYEVLNTYSHLVSTWKDIVHTLRRAEKQDESIRFLVLLLSSEEREARQLRAQAC